MRKILLVRLIIVDRYLLHLGQDQKDICVYLFRKKLCRKILINDSIDPLGSRLLRR